MQKIIFVFFFFEIKVSKRINGRRNAVQPKGKTHVWFGILFCRAQSVYSASPKKEQGQTKEMEDKWNNDN